MNNGVLGLLIFVTLILSYVIYDRISVNKLKSKKDPAELSKWLKNFTNLISNTELSTIFIFESNDGEFYIYKEKTKSRNLYLLLTYQKMYISIKNDSGEEIKRYVARNPIYLDPTDDYLIETLNELYLKSF
jgi:hypothetical protein